MEPEILEFLEIFDMGVLGKYVERIKAGVDAFCEMVEKCGIEEARETAVLNLRRVRGMSVADGVVCDFLG
jgi:hypothetical protein